MVCVQFGAISYLLCLCFVVACGCGDALVLLFCLFGFIALVLNLVGLDDISGLIAGCFVFAGGFVLV